MEIITELQGWKEVRIRLQGLKAALETVKLSRMHSSRSDGLRGDYRVVTRLMDALKSLSDAANEVPLEILTDEAVAIRNKINAMLRSCEALELIPAKEAPQAP